MKIHLFLLGLVVALFLGCGQAEMPVEQLSDEMIIDFSIREAMGEGDLFDRHRFGGMEKGFAEEGFADDAAEERKDGGMKEGPLMRRWTRWLN